MLKNRKNRKITKQDSFREGCNARAGIPFGLMRMHKDWKLQATVLHILRIFGIIQYVVSECVDDYTGVKITDSEEETADYAALIGQTLGPGCFIALDGDLGAGKTVFVRGLAQGLGVREHIVSPTFTLLREYDSGRLSLYHFDIYRLGGAEGLEDTGFYELAEADGVCVCEWAGLATEALPANRMEVRIARMEENSRRIEIRHIKGSV